MNTYEIRQAPGPVAMRRYRRGEVAWPHHRRVATVTARDELSALDHFVLTDYIDRAHPQYAGYAIEWRTERGSTWRPWTDGNVSPRRRYSAVVTLRNGRNVHTTRFEAWRP